MEVWEIKAYIHRNRIGVVVKAFLAKGLRHLVVIDVQSMLEILANEEQRYSVAIGEKIVADLSGDNLR